MKKIAVLFSVLLAFVSPKVLSQSPSITNYLTPGGVFDTVYNRLGQKQTLSDIMIPDNTGILPIQTCTAGYFKLFFESGSFFDSNTPAQTAICALFTDISGFINSPLSVPGNTNYINIYCTDTPGSAPRAAGMAGPYFAMPSNPINANQGILNNQIYKYIISEKDPYADLPIAVFPNALNFYHGYVMANSTLPGGASWNFGLSTATVSSTELDFYSIMLHEATHSGKPAPEYWSNCFVFLADDEEETS